MIVATRFEASEVNEIVALAENYQGLEFSRLLASFDESSPTLTVFDLQYYVLTISTCQMKTDPNLAPNFLR